MCERGLFNVLEHRLGKEIADSGKAMLLISGPSLADAGAMHRSLCFVSGTSYSPKVWEAAIMCFEDEDASKKTTLRLPCWVRLACRASLLAGHRTALDIKTSDEFIFGLVSRMSEMKVFTADYEADPRGGSLLWSRIVGLEVVGGSMCPLLSHKSLTPCMRTSCFDQGARP